MQGSFNSSYEWAQSPAHYQHSPGGGEWRGEYWSADQQPGAFAHALQPVALVPAPQRQMVPVHVVEKVVDRPVEKIVYVDRPVETKVPVEKLVYVDRPYEVQVEKIVTVDRPVEVEKVVTKEVPVEVEKIVIQERVVEVPVPKVTMTEHVVEVPVDRIVTKEVEVPVEKIVERVRTEFVETEKIVVQEKLPETSIKHSKLRQQRPPIPRPSSRERAQSPVSMMLPRNITDSPSTAPPGKIPPMLHDCLPQPTDTLFGMTSILQGTSRSGSPYQSAKPASSPISYDFFGSRIK